MNTSEQTAKILLKLKAVSLNSKKPFRYSSGIYSPIYTDCRLLMSYPNERQEVRDFYIQKIQETTEKFDVIAGTATAGIPHAAWVADKLNLPMVYVRGKAKDHGKGNRIEGIIFGGQKVAVIEDLISTGESSVETAKALLESGAIVTYVFSIMTYQMKSADQNFSANNLKLITLTNIEELIDAAIKLDYIQQDEKTMIMDWTSNPNEWGKKNGFE